MKNIKKILGERYKHSSRDIILDGADIVSQKGYTIIPNYVLYTAKVSPHAKLVYAMLLSYAWNKNAVFPGQERLARECGVSTRTVIRAIRELARSGFLTVIRRGQGATNVYILHFKRR